MRPWEILMSNRWMKEKELAKEPGKSRGGTGAFGGGGGGELVLFSLALQELRYYF